MTKIVDIRGSGTTDLREDIILGLSDHGKSLPSLLLWDDVGLELFDKLCATDANYYPAHRETELLAANVADIADTIATGSIVIELGSGNTRKTAVLLKAMIDQKKSFVYFALDVSPMNLQSNIHRLEKSMPEIAHDIRGLCGTYEDLKNAMDKSIIHFPSPNLTFLWLGNSLANTPAHESFGFLADLMSRWDHTLPAFERRASVQAVVAIDGCQDEDEVLKAYGQHSPAHELFLTHGLSRANIILGKTVFAVQDWEVSTDFNAKQGLLTQDFVAKKDIEAHIDGELFVIKRGERVNICCSGKWSCAQVANSADSAGLYISKEWQTQQKNYGIYLLGCAR